MITKLNPIECLYFNDFIKEDINNIKKYDWWSTIHYNNLDKFALHFLQSSSLGEKYNSFNLCDGKLETAWVEGVKGDGIGEWVKISINAYSSLAEYTTTPFTIEKLGVIPGYAKNMKTWLENNRVKTLLVIIHSPPPSAPAKNEWVVLRLNLKDEMKVQLFDVPNDKIAANDNPMVKEIWLKIEEVYKGTKYDDTCISEFIAIGGFSS